MAVPECDVPPAVGADESEDVPHRASLERFRSRRRHGYVVSAYDEIRQHATAYHAQCAVCAAGSVSGPRQLGNAA